MTHPSIPRLHEKISGLTGKATVLCLLALVAACSAPRPDETTYLEQLVADRVDKDETFSGPDSIVPLDRRSWMVPLRYYEPDLSYRVPAQLQVGAEQPIFEIPTSTGLLRTVQRVGTLEFMLHGEAMTLAALVELPTQDSSYLFVPFRDETSNVDTYGGGRYLELPNTRTGIYDLDFNRAFHPLCYFSEEFDCPFPPPENRLRTEIRAGERLPPEDEQRLPLQVPHTLLESPSAGSDGPDETPAGPTGG